MKKNSAGSSSKKVGIQRKIDNIFVGRSKNGHSCVSRIPKQTCGSYVLKNCIAENKLKKNS